MTAPQENAGSVRKITNQLGLLPHEARFVLSELKQARERSRTAEEEYSEAVNNSGGDWAFDDGASAASAEWAHQRSRDVKVLENLGYIANNVVELDYPSPETSAAQIGSRVVAKIGSFTDAFDITSRHIPGMKAEEDVELLSPDSPMGQAFMGAEAGNTVNWAAVDGRTIAAEILSVDQTAQQQFYVNE